MKQRIDTSGNDHAVASWIWRNLVPKSGQALTVQGELLRAVEKLRWEAQENGNINWDEGFVILIDFLEDTLSSHAALANSERQVVKADLYRLRRVSLPYVEDDLYDRLTAFIVAFARANPEPLERQLNLRLHR